VALLFFPGSRLPELRMCPITKRIILNAGNPMENPLIALSNELAAVADRAGRAVVAVHARPRMSSSGVLWRNGVIVTAEHTVRRDEEIRVTLPDGKTVSATLAGRDPGTDLAVLKIDGAVAPEVSTNESITPGNFVLAIGRSEETGIGAALGVVSGVSGPWHTWRGGKIDRFVRLDVGLYPGASGGAVVDVEGRVIGVVTAGLSRTSVLAIPAVTVNRVTGELLSKGHVSRGYLGVGLQPIVLPEHLKTKLNLSGRAAGGVIVLSVEPGGPAADAGLVLGDVLIALNDKPVTDTGDVQESLGSEHVGKQMKATVVRGGELAELTVTIGQRPRRRC
jgi:S1-C subfamily serine protease